MFLDSDYSQTLTNSLLDMSRSLEAPAYSFACATAIVALMYSWWAIRSPWFESHQGHTISPWHYCWASGRCKEFPARGACVDNEAFCAGWRTYSFFLTLAIVPETLVVVAILFSWSFRHRRKTVQVLRYLIVSTLGFLSVSLGLFLAVYLNSDELIPTINWELVGGWNYVLVALGALLVLLAFTFPFRRLVKGAEEPEDYESDEEDDLDVDAVSSDEDVPEEERDFQMFNKQAIRNALRARGG